MIRVSNTNGERHCERLCKLAARRRIRSASHREPFVVLLLSEAVTPDVYFERIVMAS